MFDSDYVTNTHLLSTVQTFNSCTSRPDVRMGLVVQTLIDNVSKMNQAQSGLRTKTTFNCEVVHASMSRKLGGNWAYSRVFVLYCMGYNIKLRIII